MSYVWSPTAEQTGSANTITGNWLPISATPDGAINVNTSLQITGALNATINSVGVTGTVSVTGTVQIGNTAPINISGVVQSSPSPIQAVSGYVTTIVTGGSVSFDSTAIVNAQTTGNNYLAYISGKLDRLGITGGSIQTITTGAFSATVDNTSVILALTSGNNLAVISNQLNSGISGLLASNLTEAAWVTGQVSLINTAPIPFSGVVQANVTNALLAVSGNATIVNTAPLPFSGVVQIGNTAPIPVSGVTQSNITNTVLTTQITGFNTGAVVITRDQSSSTATNYGPSGASPFTSAATFFGQALAANANRLEMFVQNIHTGISLYVNLGSAAAGTGALSMILNPSTVQGWGGSSFGSKSYKGAVQVSGGAWVAWEL